jgi:hypothetical protein
MESKRTGDLVGSGDAFQGDSRGYNINRLIAGFFSLRNYCFLKWCHAIISTWAHLNLTMVSVSAVRYNPHERLITPSVSYFLLSDRKIFIHAVITSLYV